MEAKDNISHELSGLCEVIPDDWECTVLTEELEKVERPYAMWVPVAIAEFLNRKVEIKYNNTKINPSLKIYFYNISEKEKINVIIKKEAFHSWNIPIYYDETGAYMIVTSPGYINKGTYSEEAKYYYGPLEKSLKKYFAKLREKNRSD